MTDLRDLTGAGRFTQHDLDAALALAHRINGAAPPAPEPDPIERALGVVRQAYAAGGVPHLLPPHLAQALSIAGAGHWHNALGARPRFDDGGDSSSSSSSGSSENSGGWSGGANGFGFGGVGSQEATGFSGSNSSSSSNSGWSSSAPAGSSTGGYGGFGGYTSSGSVGGSYGGGNSYSSSAVSSRGSSIDNGGFGGIAGSFGQNASDGFGGRMTSNGSSAGYGGGYSPSSSFGSFGSSSSGGYGSIGDASSGFGSQTPGSGSFFGGQAAAQSANALSSAAALSAPGFGSPSASSSGGIGSDAVASGYGGGFGHTAKDAGSAADTGFGSFDKDGSFNLSTIDVTPTTPAAVAAAVAPSAPGRSDPLSVATFGSGDPTADARTPVSALEGLTVDDNFGFDPSPLTITPGISMSDKDSLFSGFQLGIDPSTKAAWNGGVDALKGLFGPTPAAATPATSPMTAYAGGQDVYGDYARTDPTAPVGRTFTGPSPGLAALSGAPIGGWGSTAQTPAASFQQGVAAGQALAMGAAGPALANSGDVATTTGPGLASPSFNASMFSAPARGDVANGVSGLTARNTIDASLSNLGVPGMSQDGQQAAIDHALSIAAGLNGPVGAGSGDATGNPAMADGERALTIQRQAQQLAAAAMGATGSFMADGMSPYGPMAPITAPAVSVAAPSVDPADQKAYEQQLGAFNAQKAMF